MKHLDVRGLTLAVLLCGGFGLLCPIALADEGCCGCPDCNDNNRDDRCDVDCDESGIVCIGGQPFLMPCDSGYFNGCGFSPDCDVNLVPDECEDFNCNGIGDNCEQCEENWSWNSPCVASVVCPGTTGGQNAPMGMGPGLEGPEVCYCQGDWWDGNVWDFTGDDCGGDAECTPSPPYPFDNRDHAVIEKSNTYICSGGANDGEGCEDQQDCPGGSCMGVCTGGTSPCIKDSMDCGFGVICDHEKLLVILINNRIVDDLTIKTKETAADVDSLGIQFWGQGCPLNCQARTLTVDSLTLDSEFGPLSLDIDQSVTLAPTIFTVDTTSSVARCQLSMALTSGDLLVTVEAPDTQDNGVTVKFETVGCPFSCEQTASLTGTDLRLDSTDGPLHLRVTNASIQVNSLIIDTTGGSSGVVLSISQGTVGPEAALSTN